MLKFIKFYNKDKVNVKMINQSDKGFELVILDDNLLNEVLKTINSCKEQDELCVFWQIKFNCENFIVYKNCTFSTPMDNIYTAYQQQTRFSLPRKNEQINQSYGKKIKVTCSGKDFYTNSIFFKNKNVKLSNEKFKDGKCLSRIIKLSELDSKSKNHEL